MSILKERSLEDALALSFSAIEEEELFEIVGGCKDGPCNITPCGWFTCPQCK